MIVEKTVLLLSLLIVASVAGDDQLLKIGEKQTCIKQVITVFVSNRNCNALDDMAKSIVSFVLFSLLSR
jgi:hypothetical protein